MCRTVGGRRRTCTRHHGDEPARGPAADRHRHARHERQALAEESLKRRPDLKVLFTTGYTRNAIVHNGVLDQGVHLIVKPFTIEALAAKLAEILIPEEGPGGAQSATPTTV